MKIVDRKTFLTMPENTVFSEYEPCLFGPLKIKGGTLGSGNDYCEQSVADAIDADSSSEFCDKLHAAVEAGNTLTMDFDSCQRNGMFEDGMLYAVWDQEDVLALIARLEQCVRLKP